MQDPCVASSSGGDGIARQNVPINVGESMSEAEVEDANLKREQDNDPAMWLDQDQNLSFDAELEVERETIQTFDV